MTINIQDARLGRFTGETTLTGAASLSYDILYRAEGGPYSLALPSASVRRSLAVYNAGSGLITLTGTFGPSTDTTISPNQILFIISDGTQFFTQKAYWTSGSGGGSGGSSSDENTARSWFGI